MKQLLFFLLLSSLVTLFPQEGGYKKNNKYFVYFKDKENLGAFMKDKITKRLDEKVFNRRSRFLDEDKIVDSYDIPVNDNYISVLKKNGVEIIHTLKWLNAVSCFLTKEQISNISSFDFIEKIEKVRNIKYVGEGVKEIGTILSKSGFIPAEALDYGSSYQQLFLSNIPYIHGKGIRGKGVRIGILDSGFDWKRHESLTNSKVIAEWDFVFNDSITANEENDIASQHNHGTYVFSIIGGYKSGSLIGASYEAEYVLGKTEDTRSERHIEEDNYAATVEWMEGLGVDIITCSLGYNIFDTGEGNYTYSDMNGKTAITTKASEIAFSKGVLMITSAGNEGNKSWKYITAPADGFNIISVGSVNSQNVISAFSSLGPTYDGRIKPEVVAQGENVFGAQASSISAYLYNSGTSAAAPIAAGVAGLLLTAHPYLSNSDVREILLMTSDNNYKPNNFKGYGLVSALYSIEYPVIKKENDLYKCYKYFFNEVKDSVRMKFSGEGKTFLLAENETSGIESKFIFSFSKHNITGNAFYYYFEYRDSSNGIKRKPSNESDVFYYNGNVSKIINLKELFQVDYFVSNIYPNPTTDKNNKIEFRINSKKKSNITIEIFNSIGEKIKTLYKGNIDEGIYQFNWNMRSDKNQKVVTGTYFVTVHLDEDMETKKVLILN